MLLDCFDDSIVGGNGGGVGVDENEASCSDERKKRPRTAFTAAQIKALEAEFEKNKYLSVSKRMQLSKQLKLTETQVRDPEMLIAACFFKEIAFSDQDLVPKS